MKKNKNFFENKATFCKFACNIYMQGKICEKLKKNKRRNSNDTTEQPLKRIAACVLAIALDIGAIQVPG